MGKCNRDIAVTNFMFKNNWIIKREHAFLCVLKLCPLSGGECGRECMCSGEYVQGSSPAAEQSHQPPTQSPAGTQAHIVGSDTPSHSHCGYNYGTRHIALAWCALPSWIDGIVLCKITLLHQNPRTCCFLALERFPCFHDEWLTES